MPARFHCPVPLVSGEEISLPPGTVRHVQVLRLQPGDAIVLFHGGLTLDIDGLPVPGADAPACAQGAFEATITRMGRSEVLVQIGACHAALPSSAPVPEVHLAAGMPANDRMDWLVEKATELGVSGIQPLMTARGVLRLKGERATRRQAHWQGVAVAASEQSGRLSVPPVWGVRDLQDALAPAAGSGGGDAAALLPLRLVLSLAAGAQPLHVRTAALEANRAVWLLSGPEGGLAPEEEAAALQQGWLPVTLGNRVLRSETAPLAALAYLMLRG